MAMTNINSPDDPAAEPDRKRPSWTIGHLDGLTYNIFPEGTVVFTEGERGDHAYLVQSGTVEIRTGSGENSRLVDIIGEGEFFGEMALVDDEPRSATAVAHEYLICAVFTREEIRMRIERADFLAQGLLRLITRRLRKSIHRGK